MHKHQRVSIVSPIGNITSNQSSSYCLHLYTYTARDILFPDAMGTINIYQNFGKYDQRRLVEVSGTDPEKNEWVTNSINIPFTTRAFRILFEAEFGKSFYSDMGVDNIQLSEGSCEDHPEGNSH